MKSTHMLENRLREISALNNMLQSTVVAREELSELADKIARSATETANLLQKMAEQLREIPKKLDFAVQRGVLFEYDDSSIIVTL